MHDLLNTIKTNLIKLWAAIRITLIELRAEQGDIPAIKLLLDSYVDTMSVLKQTQYLLYSAIIYGNLEAIEFLIARNADVNFVDEYGRTPLYCAATLWDQTASGKLIIDHIIRKNPLSEKPDFLDDENTELSMYWDHTKARCEEEIAQLKKETIVLPSHRESIFLSDFINYKDTVWRCFKDDGEREFEKYMSEHALFYRQVYPLHYPRIQKSFHEGLSEKYAKRAFESAEGAARENSKNPRLDVSNMSTALKQYPILKGIKNHLDSEGIKNLSKSYLLSNKIIKSELKSK